MSSRPRPTFFPNDDFPFTRELERNWKVIQGELQNLPDGEFAPWPGTDLYEGKWNQFPFFVPGTSFSENQRMCPETTELLRRVPNITMAAFALLEPGAHIKPHKGFSYSVLRFHLALQVPPGEAWLRVGDDKRPWKEGEVFVFDDMHEHEAYNGTGSHRIVLMCDFLRPFRFRTSTLGWMRQRAYLKNRMKGSFGRVAEAVREGRELDG